MREYAAAAAAPRQQLFEDDQAALREWVELSLDSVLPPGFRRVGAWRHVHHEHAHATVTGGAVPTGDPDWNCEVFFARVTLSEAP